MSNLENAMVKVAAKLTGKAESEVPADSLEGICEFIADNYKGSGNVPAAKEKAIGGVKMAEAVEFDAEGATVESCAEAIAAIINALQNAGVMA